MSGIFICVALSMCVAEVVYVSDTRELIILVNVSMVQIRWKLTDVLLNQLLLRIETK